MLWGGRREFECKIYLDPDLRLLNETNIAAHDTFSQTRFFSSIMVMKLGAEFGADFDAYRKLEDGSTKSEAGFVRFLEEDPTRGFTRAQVSRRFRSYLYNLVLQHDHNRAAQYVSNVNRSTDEKPLTIDLLSKSIFANFLYASPAEESMASEAYKREQEIEHVVELMNMLHDQALGSWNAKAGANDFNQRRLTRLFRSKSAMAWSELLRDAVCAKLDLIDQEDRARPLYRDLTPESMERIKRIVERLVGWKMWNSPANAEIDRILADNKTAVKEWLKANGLTTGYLLGAAA